MDFFREMGTFFNKISVFFCKVGIYFEENFCICQARLNPFATNFLYFIPQSWWNLQFKFLYISSRWISFSGDFTVVIGTKDNAN